MKAVFIICFIGLFCSCASIRLNKMDNKPELTNITTDNINLIKGKYRNSIGDSASYPGWSMWENLFPKAKRHGDWQQANVDLTIDKDTLTASLLLDDKMIDRFTTTYKLDQNCISLKRKHTIAFFAGPVIWGVGDWKVLLGLDKNQNLVLFRAAAGTGMLVLIPVFPAGGKTSFKFDRIN